MKSPYRLENKHAFLDYVYYIVSSQWTEEKVMASFLQNYLEALALALTCILNSSYLQELSFRCFPMLSWHYANILYSRKFSFVFIFV